MTVWYFVRDGKRDGPVSAEFIADEMRRGRLTHDDLVWAESMEDWRAIREIPELHELSARTPPPLPAEMAQAAAEALAARALTPEPVFAPFHLRLAAHLIDSAILLAPALILLVMILGILRSNVESFDIDKPGDEATLQMIFNLCVLPLMWLYFAFFESSPHQATPGKIAMGLWVTTLNGERLTFLQSSIRIFWKMMTLWFGFILLFYPPRRQALHDWLSKTYIIMKR